MPESTTSPIAARAAAWKMRHENLQARAYAAQQRGNAALGRSEAALAREEAARMRAEAAVCRDDGARTRDEGARVRERAAVIRDQGALARDRATRTREDSLRTRVLDGRAKSTIDWEAIFDLDARASEQSREAANRDREAAELDRGAAERDREAAEHDRRAAARDRDAAEKDREAADKDRVAADADRMAADTDRRAAERDVTIADEWLNKSDRLISMGRLAASIAHELNNPLAALKLTIEMLHLERGEARELVTPLIGDARLALERITTVIGDVRLSLSGKLNVAARQPIDFTALIDETRRLTAPEVMNVARLIVDVQPTPPVQGVASRLGQVLINLVANAAHAISGPREQNEIRITVRPVAGGVRVEVKDTGSGIAPDVLPHIFDPLFTTRDEAGGAGLGLSLSRQIVAEHGGALTVETVVGKGSTFFVELPVVETTAEPVAAGAQASLPKTRARVLLIDDDVVVSRSLARLLARTCDVTVSHDGQQGLDRLDAEGPGFDAILCDVSMPIVDGLEFHRRLSERSPEQASAVIFVSGGATNPAAEHALATLPNVCVQKPFEIAALLELIEARRVANLERQGAITERS
ncbi:MAG: ATP-binding protein [Myxococcales bacterium]|nr:ATP-binding protein [Myxococcales bacterium]